MSRHRLGGILPVQQLRGEMDRLFTDFFQPRAAGVAQAFTGRGFPAVNMWEEGDNLFVEAELPGIKSDKLDITAVGSELTIKGERSGSDSGDGLTYHRRERAVEAFARVLQLPVEVDTDKVNASLTDGVLLITLPKSEAAKPRRVQVQAAK